MPGTLRIGTGLATGGNRAIDQLRIALHHRLGPKTDLLDHAGTEILTQHIRVIDQLAGCLAMLGIAKIERHVLLPAQEYLAGVVMRALFLGQFVHAEHGIELGLLARIFDADHFRAKVRQKPRSIRSGQETAEVDDSNALQRCHIAILSECLPFARIFACWISAIAYGNVCRIECKD